MKVAYFSIDDPRFAVARLRVLDPLDVLGPPVQVIPAVTVSESETVIDAGGLPTADVVVVQRGFPRRETRDVLEAILALKKPVIYETDDDLRIVPAWHNKPSYSEVSQYIEDFARRADLVTVATEYLAERFRPLNPNVVVLPNCLRHSLWRAIPVRPQRPSGLTIGYYGSRGHRKDLELIEDALVELSRRYADLQFVFLGCITERLARLPHARFAEFDGVYCKWPERLARAGIDIAVAPLIDCEFNNCRSHIKFLELGMLQVAAVFSELAPYRDAVQHGVSGILASNRVPDWLDALDLLINDEALRTRIAENAHAAVIGRHLLESNSWRWLDAYRGIL